MIISKENAFFGKPIPDTLGEFIDFHEEASDSYIFTVKENKLSLFKKSKKTYINVNDKKSVLQHNYMINNHKYGLYNYKLSNITEKDLIDDIENDIKGSAYKAPLNWANNPTLNYIFPSRRWAHLSGREIIQGTDERCNPLHNTVSRLNKKICILGFSNEKTNDFHIELLEPGLQYREMWYDGNTNNPSYSFEWNHDIINFLNKAKKYCEDNKESDVRVTVFTINPLVLMDASNVDWVEYLEEENQAKINKYIELTGKLLINQQGDKKVEFIKKFVETLNAPDSLKELNASLEKMKNTKLGDSSVSLYNVLFADTEKLAAYSDKDNIVEASRSIKYEDVIYKEHLACQIERMQLLSICKKTTFIHKEVELPLGDSFPFRGNIFAHLSNEDIRNFLKVSIKSEDQQKGVKTNISNLSVEESTSKKARMN
ncbi:hypothetical protein [Wolbachia endosymbiont of Pentidionis agamae]|uniref:hypothetical protein n=1 Tax=Wolbachia endosymbiont of Pentidionis agamae TaxID=3110435 RepID=UPI002FCFEE6F